MSLSVRAHPRNRNRRGTHDFPAGQNTRAEAAIAIRALVKKL